jgi:MEMO1 family protein
METIRHAAAAGRFYPGEAGELRRMIAQFLAQAPKRQIQAPKAVIVPHAGYVFSGPVAASAYALLAPARNKIRRVVLIGTAYWGPFQGLAASGAVAFDTPLGRVPLDRESIEEVLKLPQVRLIDAAHDQEHSLEVQLPFLQETLDDFRLVPLTVSNATRGEFAQVLDRLWGGEETLVVLSSDLSHYHDYETARRLDDQTARCIEQLQSGDLREQQACGRHAINGLLEAARSKGLQARTVDLRNSGDTAGSRGEVVGYGAFAFVPGTGAFTDQNRRTMIELARRSIEHGLATGCPVTADPAAHPPELRQRRACFVTLHVGGELRGCIGSIRPHRPLLEDIADNACGAAFRDSRFAELKSGDLDALEIQISVLSELEPVEFASERDLLKKLCPGIDGLLIEFGGLRGTLLPSMWGQLSTPAEFMRCLKKKAGLAPDYWSSDVKIWRFTTESFP